MNIISIDNLKSITALQYKLNVETSRIKTNKKILILSEEDIENSNSLVKLRGFEFVSIIVPKKYKFTFYETSVGKQLLLQMDNNFSYLTFY